MSLFIRALGFLVSAEFFVYIAACAALWCAALVGYFGHGFWQLFDLLPVRAFVALMALNRAPALFIGAYRRQPGAIVSAGVIVMITGLAVNYAYRFEGTVALAEGEAFAGYEKARAGMFARQPEFPFEMTSVSLESGKPRIEMASQGGEIFQLKPGENIAVPGGLEVRALEPMAAPYIQVTDSSGSELFSSFVKLRLSKAGDEDYFLLPEMPHRIYLKLLKGEDKPFGVKVMRSKLIVGRKDVAIGGGVELEGAMVLIPEVRGWVLMEVRRYPGWRIFFAGFFLICAGGAMLVVQGRRR